MSFSGKEVIMEEYICIVFCLFFLFFQQNTLQLENHHCETAVLKDLHRGKSPN